MRLRISGAFPSKYAVAKPTALWPKLLYSASHRRNSLSCAVKAHEREFRRWRVWSYRRKTSNFYCLRGRAREHFMLVEGRNEDNVCGAP
jgi:hypothetical protein